MKIADASIKDIPEILELGQEFLARINPDLKVDRTRAPSELRFLIQSADGKLLTSRTKGGELTGFLAGQVMQQAFVKCYYATDLAFCVEPNRPIHAVALTRHFIHWAKSKPKVKEVTLNISSGLGDADRLGRMYEKLGLRKMGGCFTVYL